MRKDVLVSLLAASTPMVALADANVTTEIKQDKWTSDGKFTFESMVLTSTDGNTVTQKLELAKGDYILNVGSATTANVLVNGKAIEGGAIKFTVGADRTYTLEISSSDKKEFALAIDDLTLDFDFAALHSLIQYDLSVLVKAIGELNDADKNKAILQDEAAKIAADLENVKDNEKNSYEIYDSYKLYDGQQGCTLTERINNLSAKFEGLKNNSNAYFDAKAYTDKWMPSLTEVETNYYNASTTYEYTRTRLSVTLEAIRTMISEYVAGLETAYTGGNSVSYTANIVDKNTEITEKIEALKTQISTLNTNHAEYEKTVAAIATAETTYNTQLQLVIKELVSTPEDVYAGLRETVQLELNKQYMLIIGVKNAIEAAKDNHDDYASADNDMKIIGGAVGEIIRLANGSIAEVQGLKAAYAAALESVTTIEGKLTAEITYIKNVSGEFTADVEAINKLIADFKNAVEDNNKKNLNVDYTATITKIETAITEFHKKAQPSVDNYDANARVEAEITKLSASLEEAKKTVSELVSTDGKYSAAGKYDDEKGSEDNIAELIKKLTEDLAAANKIKDVVNFEKNISGARITEINVAIVSYVEVAEQALANYETYIATVTGYRAQYTALLEKVGANGDVTLGTDASKTYGAELAAILERIVAVEKAYADAYKLDDAAHAKAMLELVSVKIDGEIATYITTLDGTFEDDKSAYDGSMLYNAVMAMFHEVEKSADDATKELETKAAAWTSDNLGLSYQAIVDKKDALQKAIDAEKAKANLHNFDLNDQAQGTKALALLNEVNEALKKILRTDIPALENEANDVAAKVTENNKKLTDVTSIYTEYSATVKTITIKLYLDSNKSEYYEGKIAELNGLLAQIKADYEKYAKEETLVKMWESTYDEEGKLTYKGLDLRYAELLVQIERVIAEAKATADNYNRSTAVTTHYNVTVNVNKYIANATNDGVSKATGASYDHYYKLLEGYKATAAAILAENATLYAEGKCTATTEANLISRIDAIVKLINAIAGDVAANNSNYKAQSESITALQTTWTEVYYLVSTKDQSSKRDELLVRLTTLQTELNAVKGEVDAAFAKGESAKQNITLTEEISRISGQVDLIKKSQDSENYNEVIAADNLVRHQAFTTAATAAQTAYSDAVKLLEAFRNIQSTDLAVAIDDILKAHEDIYEQSTKITTLKAEEQEEYDNTPAGELFDVNEKNKAEALAIKKAIDDRKALFASAVNDLAKTYRTNTIEAITNVAGTGKLDEARKNLVGYSQDVIDAAFADVVELLEALEALNTADDMLAAKLDVLLLHYVNIDQMLLAGYEPAAEAEWALMLADVDKTKLDQSTAIAGFDWSTTSTKDYVALYEAEVVEYYNVALELAANGDLYGQMAELKRLLAEFITEAGKVYDEAYSMSVGHADNIKAHAELIANITVVENNLSVAMEFISAYGLTTADGVVLENLQTYKENLETLRNNIDAAKNNGSCKTNQETYQLGIDNYTVLIEAIYASAHAEEYWMLVNAIEVVKSEYNKAISENVDNETLLLEVEKYNALINAALAKIDEIKGNSKLTNEEIRAAYLAVEKNLATYRYELSLYYEAGLITTVTTTLNTKITVISTSYEVSYGLADDYQAVFDKYSALLAQWKNDIDAIKAMITGYGNDVIFYEAKLLEIITALENNTEYKQLVTDIKNAQKKYADNEKYYAVLKGQYDVLVQSLADAKAEVEKYEYEKTNDIDAYIDYRQANTRLNTALSRLNNAYANVSLNEVSTLYLKENIESLIIDIRKNYADREYTAIADAIINGLQAELDKVTGTELYLVSTIQQVRAIYFNNYNLATALKDYIKDAKDDNINYDIDGKLVEGGKAVVFLLDEVNRIAERAEKLQAELDTAVALAEAGHYVLGDAAFDAEHVHDGYVRVNDYEKVLEYLLDNKQYMDFYNEGVEGEVDFATADVAVDGEINIADVTAVAQLVQGKTLAAPAALRKAPAKSKDAIVYNLVTEGNRQYVEISLINNKTYVGGQMDIQLPENVTLLTASLADRAFGHTLYSNNLGNGMHRLVISSISTNEIANLADNTLLRIEVIGDATGTAITNVKFADETARLYNISGTGSDGTTGINGITADSLKAKIYSVGGKMMNAIKKGVNIIRNSDGSTKKVVNK